MVTLNCSKCQNPYEVPNYRRYESRFCSQACRRNRESRSCSICRVTVTRAKSNFSSAYTFCSRPCQDLWLLPQSQEAKRRKAASRRRTVDQPSDCRLINLTNDSYAVVDVEHYDWLMCSFWRRSDLGYATRDQAPRRMHRAIMERSLGRPLTASEQVDHIDGDRLNNRRTNLRIATNRENGQNKRPVAGSSSYKGVYWLQRTGRWVADIKSSGSTIRIGSFINEVDAALAYDAATIQVFDDYAWLNLIGR